MKKYASILSATICLLVLFSMADADAEKRIIETTGVYTPDPHLNETRAVALLLAKNEALRHAVEQAISYVKAQNDAANLGMTTSEINAVASQFMRIESEKQRTDESDDGSPLRYVVKLRATIDDDKTLLKNIARDRMRLDETVRQNRELQRELAKIVKEMTGLRQSYPSATLTGRTRLRERSLRNDARFVAADYLSKGNAFFARGEYEQALEEYNKSIEFNDNNAEAHNNRGMTYYRLHNLANATKDFARAVELNPDFCEAHNNRGLLRYDTGNPAASIADFNTALRINPQCAAALNNRGNAYAAIGKYYKAEQDYLAAIEISGKDAQLHISLGSTYFSQNQMDKALAEFGTAIRIDPDCAEAYYNRAAVYYTLGRYLEALHDTQKAVELDINYRAAADLRDKIQKYLDEYMR